MRNVLHLPTISLFLHFIVMRMQDNMPKITTNASTCNDFVNFDVLCLI